MKERPILVADESIRRRTLIQEILVPEPACPVRCKITEGSHQLTKGLQCTMGDFPNCCLATKDHQRRKCRLPSLQYCWLATSNYIISDGNPSVQVAESIKKHTCKTTKIVVCSRLCEHLERPALGLCYVFPVMHSLTLFNLLLFHLLYLNFIAPYFTFQFCFCCFYAPLSFPLYPFYVNVCVNATA